MGIYLGSNQIDNIELIQYQNINTDIEDALINRTITSYSNSEISNIRSYAFYQCSSLTVVNLPQVITVERSAFARCISLTSVNLPQVTLINSGAFEYCFALTSIDFSNCISIGPTAFNGCSSLETVNFPNCTLIGNYAFSRCSHLSLISFPNCTTINTNAFSNCFSLTSVYFPNCTSIGSYGFAGCTSLISVSFPNCTLVGNGAFSQCMVLTLANFPNCISISSYAFNYCSSLTTISFPQCAIIDASAFSCCYNLLSVYLLGSFVPNLVNINVFQLTPISGYTTSTGGVYGSIYVPASLYNSYITATNWSNYSSRIVSTNIVYNGSYEVYHVSYTANNVNYASIPNVTRISPDTLYIEINGIKYECPKQDVSSDYGEPAYAYGYYGDTTQWSSDDYPFDLVFLNGNTTLAILSSVAKVGDYISLTVFYT